MLIHLPRIHADTRAPRVSALCNQTTPVTPPSHIHPQINICSNENAIMAFCQTWNENDRCLCALFSLGGIEHYMLVSVCMISHRTAYSIAQYSTHSAYHAMPCHAMPHTPPSTFHPSPKLYSSSLYACLPAPRQNEQQSHSIRIIIHTPNLNGMYRIRVIQIGHYSAVLTSEIAFVGEAKPVPEGAERRWWQGDGRFVLELERWNGISSSINLARCVKFRNELSVFIVELSLLRVAMPIQCICGGRDGWPET